MHPPYRRPQRPRVLSVERAVRCALDHVQRHAPGPVVQRGVQPARVGHGANGVVLAVQNDARHTRAPQSPCGGCQQGVGPTVEPEAVRLEVRLQQRARVPVRVARVGPRRPLQVARVAHQPRLFHAAPRARQRRVAPVCQPLGRVVGDALERLSLCAPLKRSPRPCVGPLGRRVQNGPAKVHAADDKGPQVLGVLGGVQEGQQRAVAPAYQYDFLLFEVALAEPFDILDRRLRRVFLERVAGCRAATAPLVKGHDVPVLVVEGVRAPVVDAAARPAVEEDGGGARGGAIVRDVEGVGGASDADGVGAEGGWHGFGCNG